MEQVNWVFKDGPCLCGGTVENCPECGGSGHSDMSHNKEGYVISKKQARALATLAYQGAVCQGDVEFIQNALRGIWGER
jgi:hypothetical protein